MWKNSLCRDIFLYLSAEYMLIIKIIHNGQIQEYVPTSPNMGL